MTNITWLLLAVTVVIALVDWFAVFTENRPLEYVMKPATMVALGAAALAIEPDVSEMRPWFVAAIVFSLAGDVFLMLPDPKKFFVPGLASFLVGHIAYIVGMLKGDVSVAGAVVGAVMAFTFLVAIGPTLLKGAKDVDRALPIPVLLYMLTISVMVCCAIGSGSGIAIAGALLFYLSDFCIGWSRFVTEFNHHRMAIIVTYHLAQILLVASLATHT